MSLLIYFGFNSTAFENDPDHAWLCPSFIPGYSANAYFWSQLASATIVPPYAWQG
jgi:hypothetical protein